MAGIQEGIKAAFLQALDLHNFPVLGHRQTLHMWYDMVQIQISLRDGVIPNVSHTNRLRCCLLFHCVFLLCTTCITYIEPEDAKENSAILLPLICKGGFSAMISPRP